MKLYIRQQQTTLTGLVSDWITENAERLLHRDIVPIGPVTSDGAELLYRALASYHGFERQILYMAVSKHLPNPSGDYFAVKFVGNLEKPDQTQYEAWVKGQIAALEVNGFIPGDTEVSTWGQAMMHIVDSSGIHYESIPSNLDSINLADHMRAEAHYKRTGQWIRPLHTTSEVCPICKAIESTLDPESIFLW